MIAQNSLEALSDAHISRTIAAEAGAALLELRQSFGEIDPTDRATADSLRKQGDRLAHVMIAEYLAKHRPDDSLLSEEGKDDDRRLSAERIWIVDPLDGTWEFGQGRVDFAVHVALWTQATSSLSACTVDLPAQGMSRSMLDETTQPAPLPVDRPVRIVASRTRPPATLARAVEILSAKLAEAGLSGSGVEVVDVGSVGAKVNEILCGRAEGYVHDTGFYEWDVAAPYGVAAHYGYSVSHVDGSPVTFNHMPPYVTDLCIAHPALAGLLRTSLAEAAGL